MPRDERFSCSQKENEVCLFLFNLLFILIEKIRPGMDQTEIVTSIYTPPNLTDMKHTDHFTVIGKNSLGKTE